MALGLLRLDFLGIFDDYVMVNNPNDQRLAAFLAAEGVLQADPLHLISQFKMSSPYIDSLIRQCVISIVYQNAPNIAVPLLSNSCRTIDFLSTLKKALKFFDRSLIEKASERAYKTVTEVKVDSVTYQNVPRESVYNQEMMRILINWLAYQHYYNISGQWHFEDINIPLKEVERYKYLDIVIEKNKRKILLKVIAIETRRCIIKHLEKTSDYKNRISAEEAWVIHFTCQDEYLVNNTYWLSDNILLYENIYIIYIWHNKSFKKVQMSARWKDIDGKIQQINNQLIC